MDRPTCSTCPCYIKTTEHEGMCYLDPPTVVSIGWDGQGEARFANLRPEVESDSFCTSHPEFAEWIQSVNKEVVKRPCKVKDCGRETHLGEMSYNSDTNITRAFRLCAAGHGNGWEDIPAHTGPLA